MSADDFKRVWNFVFNWDSAVLAGTPPDFLSCFTVRVDLWQTWMLFFIRSRVEETIFGQESRAAVSKVCVIPLHTDNRHTHQNLHQHTVSTRYEIGKLTGYIVQVFASRFHILIRESYCRVSSQYPFSVVGLPGELVNIYPASLLC